MHAPNCDSAKHHHLFFSQTSKVKFYDCAARDCRAIPGVPLTAMAPSSPPPKGAVQSSDPSLYLIVSYCAAGYMSLLADKTSSPQMMSYTSKTSYATPDLSSLGFSTSTTNTNMAPPLKRLSCLSELACSYLGHISFGRCTWN